MGGREFDPHLTEQKTRVPEVEKLVEEVVTPDFSSSTMPDL